MSEQETPPVYDPRPRLRRVVEGLRLPAGPDPRFSTPEAIAANRDAFVAEVHDTWKNIQALVIAEIVKIEITLARGDASAMPKGFVAWLRYVCRLWRRVNDAVAWSMVTQPHMIRRLCANRPRPTLIQSNPQAVAAVLDDINKDPTSMAIWNDATTCIDVGDITARRNSKELEFIELKEGKVNQAIGELHEALSKHRKAGDTAAAEKAMDDFFAAYGAKGFQQAMRFTKQLMRDFKVMDLVNREKGSDPDLDIDVEIIESSAISETHDFELTECLRQADAERAALKCIDGCLWIFVSHDRKLARREAIAEFSRRVFEASPETKRWLQERTGKDFLHPVGTVDQWSFVPTAVPLFLRPLDVEDVLDLVYGKLLGRVLLFFDWSAFERVVGDAGCELTWVKPRPVSGRYIEQIVGKRTPRIGRSDGHGIRLGVSPMVQVMAEGIRPSSVAAQYAEMIQRLSDAAVAP